MWNIKCCLLAVKQWTFNVQLRKLIIRLFCFNPFKPHNYLLKDWTQFNRIGSLYLTLNTIKCPGNNLFQVNERRIYKKRRERRKRIGNTLSWKKSEWSGRVSVFFLVGGFNEIGRINRSGNKIHTIFELVVGHQIVHKLLVLLQTQEKTLIKV